MSDPRPIRVAIIGCGNIALAGHLPAVLAHPRFELRGLCDVRPQRTALLLDECRRRSPAVADQVRCVTDFLALLADKQIDAAILALHPEHSVGVAIDLLRRGVPVLDEKPLAPTVEDGLRLRRVIEETGGVYQVAFCFRYCRFVRDVAGSTASFTRPCLYQVSVYDERPSQHTADGQAMIQGILRRTSAINHEGSHVIDWLSVLNPSPIVRVKSSVVKSARTHAGPNLWLTQMDMADGSTLQLNVGWLFEDQPRCTMRVLADNGRLDMDMFGGAGEVSRGGRAEPVKTQPYAQDWAAQLDTFAAGIDAGRAVAATIDDGLRALRVTSACERSAASHSAVEVA